MRGLTPMELLAWKAPYQQFIIASGILLAQGTLGIYGAEGVWKSIISLHTALTISSGGDWFGFKTAKSPTYYYQTEIPQAMLQERTRKYMLGSRNATNDCWLCTELYSKIDKGWHYAELEKEIGRTMPKVLIIDPLNTSIGANLNDDYESGLAIDRFNMLRDKYKLAIIIIHHNRKEEHKEGETYHYGSDEWGGSGRWKKWLDSVVYVEKLADHDPLVDLRLIFEKNPRNAEVKIKPIEIQTSRLDLSVKLRVGGVI